MTNSNCCSTRFKVGDRVRFIGTPVGRTSAWKHAHATIIEITDYSRLNYKLDFPSSFSGNYIAREEELELIEPPKTELWIVICFGTNYRNTYSNEKDAREAAELAANKYASHRIYISKAVGYVESVPQPTTRYVEL